MRSKTIDLLFFGILRLMKGAHTTVESTMSMKSLPTSSETISTTLESDQSMEIKTIKEAKYNLKRKHTTITESQNTSIKHEERNNESPKQAKSQKSLMNSNVDLENITYLNRDMMTIGESSFVNLSFELPEIVKYNFLSTQKWIVMTNIFRKIFEKYHKFVSSTEFDFDKFIDKILGKSLKSLDTFYETFLDSVIMKKYDLCGIEGKFDLFEDNLLYLSIFQKIIKEGNTSVALYHKINHRVQEYDIRSLTELLLYEITLNKQELVELNSIILTVFNNYPSENSECEDQHNLHRLKCFIGKIIILINLANDQSRFKSAVSKEVILERINKCILKNLIWYLLHSKSLRTYHYYRYVQINRTIQDYRNIYTPIRQDNFFFVYFSIGAYGDLLNNYVKPVSVLQKYDDFHEISYFYLIKAVERLNKLGEFIINSSNHIKTDN